MNAMRLLRSLAIVLAFGAPHIAHADLCASCAEWNRPHEPFRIYGNTYYVGTAGLASILIVSDKGDILIDGGLPDTAPQIVANIKKLGFKIEDVRLILNTHVHFDHAGGIAELQRLSGAAVKASPSSVEVLKTGKPGLSDPQHDGGTAFPAVPMAEALANGEVVSVGPLFLTAHFTPGHTPGGTSWTWASCEGSRCLNMVYLDSLNPVSSDGFKFSHNTTYPNVLADFRRSFALVSVLPCDIAVSNHPGFTDLWKRLDSRNHGHADAMIDPAGCRRFADAAKASLDKRLAAERKQ